MSVKNPGLRILAAQQRGRTHLCVGLDPVAKPVGDSEPLFYNRFVKWDGGAEALKLFRSLFDASFGSNLLPRTGRTNVTSEYLAGLTAYYFRVIDISWANDIRVYKPQIAFFEQFGPYGMFLLQMLCHRLHQLARQAGEEVFLILDCKRGDIDHTQMPYYAAYLTEVGAEIVAGITGCYGFDTMTVTTWMGRDVLTPGLPYFQNGQGCIIVTRTSNPSGTTMQDGCYLPAGDNLELSGAQEEFRYDEDEYEELRNLFDGDDPLAHEVMAHQTTKFSAANNLDQDGVSSLFSVIGATTKMTRRFRLLRPGGIALVPGFGRQGGKFDRIEALISHDGPLAGNWGAIFASSQAHNHPWLRQYGGGGDPFKLDEDLGRAIQEFRVAEENAYKAADIDYPYAA